MSIKRREAEGCSVESHVSNRIGENPPYGMIEGDRGNMSPRCVRLGPTRLKRLSLYGQSLAKRPGQMLRLLRLVTALAIARTANVHAGCYGCYGCTPQMACRGEGFVRLNAKQPALRYLSCLLLKLSLAAFRSLGTAWDGIWDG